MTEEHRKHMTEGQKKFNQTHAGQERTKLFIERMKKYFNTPEGKALRKRQGKRLKE